MARSLGVGLMTLVLFAIASAELRGQDIVLSELYGRGVHAYFENDFSESQALLSEAIELGSRDPRAYYYRGLIHAQSGRSDQAEADFQTGARLEVTNDERIYPVGHSLQRIQGPLRLTLEAHRRDARLAVKVQEHKEQRARYDRVRQAEGDVLRAPSPPAALPAAPGVDPSDPFAGDADAPRAVEAPPAELPEAPADAGPAPPAAPAAPATPDDNPFGEIPFGAPLDAPPATEPADDNPFGALSPPAEAAPPEGAPAEPAPALPAEDAPNPFGEAEVDPADVFGAEPEAEDSGAAAGPSGPLGAIFRALTRSLPDAPAAPADAPASPSLAPASGAGQPAEAPAASPDSDPFGVPLEAPASGANLDDIFGTAPPTQPPAAAEPAAEPATEDEDPAADNPFGDNPFGEDPFGTP